MAFTFGGTIIMHKILVLLAVLCFSTLCYSQENTQKTLLIFSADWCGHCKIAHHDMKNNDDLLQALKSYTIVDIDADEQKDLMSGYKVRTLPTFIILLNNGKEFKRYTGYKNAKDLTRFLK